MYVCMYLCIYLCMYAAIVNCFERANVPNLNEEEIRDALSFVVVGAGPTGIQDHFVNWCVDKEVVIVISRVMILK